MTRPGLTTATQPSGEPLPLPIRVSAGFFVNGLSGEMLIHTLPPRLILRVIAIRAASIWRLVNQPSSSALIPKSPNCTLAWPFVSPRRRPRWCLRNLVFLGSSIYVVLFLGGRFGFSSPAGGPASGSVAGDGPGTASTGGVACSTAAVGTAV